ncbi:MAG: efflux RND transporter periplasmic adaptor subunit [Bacteroidetes bacterium]|uniref:Efflux RND transporter periplasmic adaptor subunit n=1 Tax=Candidatus Cryptobacteroides excrementavium TaxID=2840759 RepID=A0A9D9J1S6_9BACT|nr:efflux RND transporter periplasmic adaptor subunit [Candidatus Cryptobacteroides excrementavium]
MKGLNVITIGLCLFMGMTSCKQQTAQQPMASTYPLMTLAPEDRTLTVSYTAVIEGKQDVEIRPQVSGFVTDVLVKEGAKVRKGETLFIIDTIPYAATYQQAKAAVATAEAQMATARLTLEGDEELYREKVISDFQLQTTRNTYNTAVAALAQARAQEASAANNLSFAKVTSPVDGVAGMTSVRVGALVSASMAEPLINVTDNSQMYVYFSLPEKEVLGLTRQYGSIDKTLAAYPAVSLTLNDGSLYENEGKIDVISRMVDKATGTVSLRAVFSNPDGRLMSGGSANINIPYTRTGVIVIPQEATFEIQDKIFTYKVVDGKAASTQIKVFKINNGREYIVEEGLNEGDVIVAKGAGLLREGTPVAAAPSVDKATNEGE